MASNSPCIPYDKEAETINEFLTRFAMQCSELLHKFRNDDSKQVALLLRAVPVNVFTEVQRALAPDSVTDASFDLIKETLIKLYAPPKSVLGASINFFNCKQKPGQSIDEFARQVKLYSQECGFEAQVRLSRIQRDVFLAGLHSAPVVTAILQISDNIEFDEAVAKAKAITQLRHDAQGAGQSRVSTHQFEQFDEEVHHIQRSTVPSSYVCVRCGKQGAHRAEHCFALKLKCNYCSKIGHIAKVCKSAQRMNNQSAVRHFMEGDNNSSYEVSHLQPITAPRVTSGQRHNSPANSVSASSHTEYTPSGSANKRGAHQLQCNTTPSAAAYSSQGVTTVSSVADNSQVAYGFNDRNNNTSSSSNSVNFSNSFHDNIDHFLY